MERRISTELEGIDLGDQRLNERSMVILENLAADSATSINAAHNGWAETQAAYRFFNNRNVTPEKILQPHRLATERRIDEESVALLVQDTTELDFTAHPPRDAGLLDDEQRFGFYDHSHLAFTTTGISLGVVAVDYFSRTAESLGKAKERASLPIEEKESFRWLRGYRLACELQAAHPATQIVSVADCECDIYDIFVDAQQQATPADFVIRARLDRRTPEPDPEAGPHAYRRVLDDVAASKLLATRVIELPQTPHRAARTATLEIRALEARIKPPHARGRLPEVVCNLILVEEVGGPEDGTDVSWLLLTSLPIDTIAAVLLAIDYYMRRWGIEVFFRVYKTGCRVEDVRLETNARLLNCLTMYKIVAWRVMHVTFLGRECPDLPCDAVFAEPEWKSVWKVVSDEPLPETAPPLKVFIPLLAQLGGHNGRKSDRPPGAQAIWIGIRRMTDFALAWLRFGRADTKT
ncbi:MAG: IS4 family transposase [Planctomycetia bacterium]|nr:IS4 family transposase [Planctomycetia bacterium]